MPMCALFLNIAFAIALVFAIVGGLLWSIVNATPDLKEPISDPAEERADSSRHAPRPVAPSAAF